MTPRRPRSDLGVALVYIDTTIPPGMTIAAYRRSRPQHRSLWHRLWHWNGGATPAKATGDFTDALPRRGADADCRIQWQPDQEDLT